MLVRVFVDVLIPGGFLTTPIFQKLHEATR